MTRLRTLAVGAISALCGVALVVGATALAGWPTRHAGQAQGYGPYVPSVITSGASGSTCADDKVAYNNGVVGCYVTTNVAPQSLLVRPQSSFSGGAQTSADLNLSGGIDEHIFTVVGNAATCSGDIMTVVYNGTSVTCTEAGSPGWVANNNTTTSASLLAVCIDGLAGVQATNSANVVLIRPDDTTYTLTLTTSDTNCATKTDGTAGNVNVKTNQVNDGNVTVAGTLTSNGLTVLDGSTDGVQFVSGHTCRYVVLGGPIGDSSGAWTYTDVTGVAPSVVSGTYYDFRVDATITSALGTTSCILSLDGPAATTYSFMTFYSATATTWSPFCCGADDCPSAAAANTSLTAGTRAQIIGHIVPSANGVLQLRLATEIDTSACTVLAGARMVICG